MGDLLDGYRLNGSWDEMFAASDEPRAHYASLHAVLGHGGPSRNLGVTVELTRVALTVRARASQGIRGSSAARARAMAGP
jgi:hypothetical protein